LQGLLKILTEDKFVTFFLNSSTLMFNYYNMDTVQLNNNMSFKQLIDVVKKLSPAEKLKLNAAIWDEAMQIPAEHIKIVTERMVKTKQNPKRMLDWNAASKTLKS